MFLYKFIFKNYTININNDDDDYHYHSMNYLQKISNL